MQHSAVLCGRVPHRQQHPQTDSDAHARFPGSLDLESLRRTAPVRDLGRYLLCLLANRCHTRHPRQATLAAVLETEPGRVPCSVGPEKRRTCWYLLTDSPRRYLETTPR